LCLSRSSRYRPMQEQRRRERSLPENSDRKRLSMSHDLEIKYLVKEYTPGNPILKGINLKIDGAGLTAIIGPSGTGKSTLLRCINRLVDPSKGEIWFTSEGQRTDLAQLRGSELRLSRRRIGMVF